MMKWTKTANKGVGVSARGGLVSLSPLKEFLLCVKVFMCSYSSFLHEIGLACKGGHNIFRGNSIGFIKEDEGTYICPVKSVCAL